ncbi:discoidin domain-containing protein [Humibacter ginsenosidimutans]|uniref:Choice-of-anchor D domain-containing protein n=1 Tax=Humibacter ginsenosidimutans TaxID=2599293 RepID=A0A5B8M8Q0_9MICO|nr:discoidin domain-containing protein [Humibacter ginsenosidimutans]QDZ16005.1 choice-of-anchor D domain-containing protein [Humibacter ginsenosidimutans]
MRSGPLLSRTGAAVFAVAAITLAGLSTPAWASIPAHESGPHTPATPTSVAGTARHSLPDNAGAPVPFREYQAEDARTNGTVIGASTDFTDLAAEASGRRAVRLSHRGQYVAFTLAKAANAVDVRYAIPDSADGAGLEAKLGVYVDGHAAPSLSLTSAYSDVYGVYPFTNDPSDGGDHHYFDDVRAAFGRTLPAGTVVKLQVDAGDTASWYVIDTADFESVPAPLAAPAGAIDATNATYGADPTGANDSTAAIQRAIDAAAATDGTVYLPAGTYTVSGQLDVDHVSVVGAGPWYTTISGNDAGFTGGQNPSSSDVHLSHLAVFGDDRVRDDANTQDTGISGGFSDSTVTDVWIQHTKVGVWIDGPTSNLKLDGLRIQDTMADGINLAGGVTDSIVTNTFVRNTGDDGMAMWSTGSADTGNVFSHDTVSVPVLANAYAIYGGSDNTISDDIAADTVTQGGGIHVGNRFGAVPLAGTTKVDGNVLVSTGDVVPGAPTDIASIWLYAQDEAMTGTVDITGNTILDAPYTALQFYGDSITNVTVDGLLISRPGSFPLQLQAPGSATLSHVVATGVRTAGTYDCRSGFRIVDGGGNAGLRGTHCGFPPNDLLTPSTSEIDFGDHDLGTTASRQFTLGNEGPDTVVITGIHAPKGYATTGSCTRIRPHGTCTVTVTFSPTSAGNYAGQISIDSTSPAGPYTVTLTGVGFDPNGDLALGQTVTASSSTPGFPASQAVDGNADTYWESVDGTFPQTLTVDLGESRSIDRVTLQLPANWGARTESGSILTSADGTHFTTVASGDFVLDPDSGNVATITFARTDARYVQLQVTGNTGWDAAQISELGVWAN